MRKISTIVYQYFDTLDIFSSDELKRHTLVMMMGVLSFCVQLTTMFIYLTLKCPPMVVCTMLGTLSAILCCLLTHQHYYNLAGLTMTFGIILIIVADDYFIGFTNNSILYLFIILVITLHVSYRPKAITATLCGLLPLLMTGLYLFGQNHIPQYSVGNLMKIFAVINIFSTSAGIVLIFRLTYMISCYAEMFNKKRIAELETQIYRDALTQMYNRHYISFFFEQMMKEQRKETNCIAITDIDDFKKINDTYGHDAGDLALCEISCLIQKNIRPSDVIIRWGGEEFVIILRNIVPDEAYVVLEKLRILIARHEIKYQEIRFRVTLTFGLSILNLTDPDESIKDCDKKLYQGKRTTKNIVIR